MVLCLAAFFAFSLGNQWFWRVTDGQTANLLYAAAFAGAIPLGFALQRGLRLLGGGVPAVDVPGAAVMRRFTALSAVILAAGVFFINLRMDCDPDGEVAGAAILTGRSAEEFAEACASASMQVLSAGMALAAVGLVVLMATPYLAGRLARR